MGLFSPASVASDLYSSRDQIEDDPVSSSPAVLTEPRGPRLVTRIEEDSEGDFAQDELPTNLHSAWSEIRREDVPLWDNLLLTSNASVYQYPYWNEPQRSLGLRPRYLVWENEERLGAFVCIMTVGAGPAKVGLIFRGPVLMPGQKALPPGAAAQLLEWARSQGYMFLRFTHSEDSVLDQVASAGDARKVDAFPYFIDYPILSPDYVIEQRDSETETLAGFDREVRRKIRRAADIGYEFRCSDSPEALARLWPMFQECARRKHFRLERPLSIYREIMRGARPNGCARVFAVYLAGKPVGSTVIVRDRNTAHCLLAAFTKEHRQSAVFLHWNSMRYMYVQGATRYNLGPGPRTLARFKEQFTAPSPNYPQPVTMVLKPNYFRVWMSAVYPVAKKLRPLLRGLVSTVALGLPSQPKGGCEKCKTVGTTAVEVSGA